MVNRAAVVRLLQARIVEAPVSIASLAITLNPFRTDYREDICEESEYLYTVKCDPASYQNIPKLN